MRTGIQQGFKKMIRIKLQEKKQTDYMNDNERLRARLAAWKHNVDEERTVQGGQSSLIWNLEAQRLLEINQKASNRKQKELEDVLSMGYNSKELYLRMQRVQK